jgi:hypothetical protein
MRRGILFFLFVWIGASVNAQFSLTTLSYAQDFNALANAGTSSTVPSGWIFQESGSAANTVYTAGTGSLNTGDTYSYGSTSAADRALGGLRSGSLTPQFGFFLINNTGSVVDALSIQYTGEQWRLGATGRADRLDCQYSTNAISLTTGVWIDVDPLDFTAPVTAGTVGALDGNLAANKTAKSSFLAGLSIPPGGTFFIRWNDLEAAGADDGLGIDDFTITATSSLPLAAAYFRSAQSGNWNQASTWESSADNVNWNPAATYPTSSDNAITVRNGHFVTITAAANADELLVESGASLQILSNTSLSVDNGTSTDMIIDGILVVNGAQPGGFGSVVVNSGGVVRVNSNSAPAQSDDMAFANANIKFMTGSVFDWNSNLNTPTWGGQTYFTSDQSPTFRISQLPGTGVGAGTPTLIYGTLEVNSDIILNGVSDKTFVNGIIGSGNITPGTFTGKIIINGATASLGGTGILNLPASPSVLEIGTGTTVTMTSSKTINGDVSILANSYIDAGTYDLTVSGNISGGATNYVRTASSGSLILKTVSTARTFPVGHTQYNPIIIDNGSGHDWTVLVNDGVVADPPNGTTGAVLLTWNITPSVNPPTSGADITFQFDNSSQVGAQFNTAPYNTPDNAQAWHRKNGYWLAAGVPMPLTNAGGSTRTLKVLGLTQFSPYAVSRVVLPLPVRLIGFKAERMNDKQIRCGWTTATACRIGVQFKLEASINGVDYQMVSSERVSDARTRFERTVLDANGQIRFLRLRIIEPDGRVQVGPVVEIGVAQNRLSVERLWVSGGQLRAEVHAPGSGRADWLIVDALGRTLSRGHWNLQKGQNAVSGSISLPVGIHRFILVSLGERATTPLPVLGN